MEGLSLRSKELTHPGKGLASSPLSPGGGLQAQGLSCLIRVSMYLGVLGPVDGLTV